LVQLKQTVRCSGLTDLAITKLDVLGGFEELKVCTEYQIKKDNEEMVIEEMPASLTEYRQIEPVYKTLKGWKDLSDEEIEEMCQKGYSSLPKNMQKYIEFIEEFTGVPTSIISIGPKRHQTILK
jgi:adenylosuccinate synthase